MKPMTLYLPAFLDIPEVIAGLTTTAVTSNAIDLVASVTSAAPADVRLVDQVHQSRIVGDDTWQSGVQADGITTMRRGMPIAVRLADCCGILMVDPTRGVVAAIHSGWRGTAQNIAGAAVAHMTSVYGVTPQHVHVWLSPCASGVNYQVGPDVQRVLPDFCVPHPDDPSRWLFDNVQAITHQLSAEGVTNIVASGLCTIADRRFHSHRRDKERSGRGLAFIALR